MPPFPRPNPKLMVVGDSLPQGCRSFSVTREMCAQSWPARYAAAKGVEFVPPNFPRPVLFNLETLIRRLSPVENVRDGQSMGDYLDELVRDYNAWMVNTSSTGPAAFDNLSVSGTLFSDITQRTAATCQADITAFANTFGSTLTSRGQLLKLVRHGSDLRKLHLGLNGRFVLNPTNNPAFQDFSSLDWVKARKPETLIVHAGHNYGLYEIGSAANGGDPAGNPVVANGFFEDWEVLAEEIARLPAEITLVYVGLLPKVGASANLQPLADARTDGYADEYEPVFSTSGRRLSGRRLKQLDEAITAVNERMKAVLSAKETVAGTAGRTKFVDVFKTVEQHDFKNSLDSAKQLEGIGPVPFDNRYLDSRRTLLGLRRELTSGGLQTIDGMHLSGVGYSLVACDVLAAEGVSVDRTGVLRKAFADDRLLSSPPHALGAVVSALSLIRENARNRPDLVSNVLQQLGQGFTLDGETSIFDIIRFVASLGK